ncbi:hypothetical protein [Streptomyces albicerus]|uniref:hypothetical protein n=1 Tax=Streptomyces albicerus TaxID=2569859 RepID=UPI001788BBC1|nr:hypothetical protein [Streptomyces albicerus]
MSDQTNGWAGQAVAGDRVFVVTHEAPKSWEFDVGRQSAQLLDVVLPGVEIGLSRQSG